MLKFFFIFASMTLSIKACQMPPASQTNAQVRSVDTNGMVRCNFCGTTFYKTSSHYCSLCSKCGKYHARPQGH